MSLGPSYSSDEHLSFSQLFGHRHAGWENQNTSVMIVHLWFIGIRDSCLSALVCWWKQHHGTATSGFDCLDRRNRDNFVRCVLVNWPQYHDVVIVVRESETEDPQ